MNRLSSIAAFVQPLIGFSAGALFIRVGGWQEDLSDLPSLAISSARLMLLVFTSLEILRAVLSRSWLTFFSERKVRLSTILIALIVSFLPDLIRFAPGNLPQVLSTGFALLAITIISIPTVTRFSKNQWLSRQHPGVIGIAAFAFAICIGAVLLHTPNAAADHQSIAWDDAFFTSASAVCVTGLITLDTEYDFSYLGQFVILILIQAGGLGIMTWAYLMAVAFGERISLRDQVILKDLLTHNALSGMKRRLAFIVTISLIFETIGTITLFNQWDDVGASFFERVFHSTFHAISSYCNAGFSSFSQNLMDTRAAQTPSAIVTIGTLVVLGGLGTPVWIDLADKAKVAYKNAVRTNDQDRERHFMSLHSRLALATTFSLIFLGGLGLQLAKLASRTEQDRYWAVSLFDSITARTAGFNLADISHYSHGSLSLLMILMFIGGCPGSTAGGIKCTTFSIVLINLRQVMQARKSAIVWNRYIPPVVISQALAIITIGGSWIIVASVLIQWIHPDFAFFDILFETVSALGTVGLSRGITAELAHGAKWIIIATMFVGRLGLLFVICSLLPPRPDSNVTYPAESPLLS